MQKIIKVDNTVIVVLSNGASYQRTDLSEEEFDALCNSTTDDEVLNIMSPKTKEIIEEIKAVKQVIVNIENSKILTKINDLVYWKDVSMLSLPPELIVSILDAESNEDELKLETYKNFWTLMSLNTNEECRKNLFSFLMRHDLVISRCGFFISYRNALLQKGVIGVNDKEDLEFTDHHSRTTKIKIGEMVMLDRSMCDSNSDNECSRGLKV